MPAHDVATRQRCVDFRIRRPHEEQNAIERDESRLDRRVARIRMRGIGMACECRHAEARVVTCSVVTMTRSVCVRLQLCEEHDVAAEYT